MRKSSSSGSQTIKLPLQLASLIHGEAGTFLVESTEAAAEAEGGEESTDVMDNGDEMEMMSSSSSSAPMTSKRKRGQCNNEDSCTTTATPPVQSQKAQQNSLNVVISAAQNRHTKELGSYVRTVCMRMGFVQ